MKNQNKYKGTLVIGDEMYLNELAKKSNAGMESLIYSNKLDNFVEVSVIDIEGEYPIAVATIHFYKDTKEMHFDAVAETLSTPEGLEYRHWQLGCDTASFEIIGKNQTSINTLSDGCYGDVFEANTDETIITFYVTHDSARADELKKEIEYALGL